jgi:hypothetical protein
MRKAIFPWLSYMGFGASYQNVMKMEGVTFEEYVNVDDDVHIMGFPTDILESVMESFVSNE